MRVPIRPWTSEELELLHREFNPFGPLRPAEAARAISERLGRSQASVTAKLEYEGVLRIWRQQRGR